MVGIGVCPALLADEFMTRNFVHGPEHTLVVNPAAAQLLLHHGKPFSRKWFCSVAVHITIVSPGQSSASALKSFLSFADVHIKAEHTVLIPDRYDGNILVNVVFQLNYRLRRLREAGGISKSHVVVDC